MLKSPSVASLHVYNLLHPFCITFFCILGRRRPLFCRPCAQVARPNHPLRRRRRRRRWCLHWALELCPLPRPWHRWRRPPRCGRRPCQSRCLARPLACLWYRKMLKKVGRETPFLSAKTQDVNDSSSWRLYIEIIEIESFPIFSRKRLCESDLLSSLDSVSLQLQAMQLTGWSDCSDAMPQVSRNFTALLDHCAAAFEETWARFSTWSIRKFLVGKNA